MCVRVRVRVPVPVPVPVSRCLYLYLCLGVCVCACACAGLQVSLGRAVGPAVAGAVWSLTSSIPASHGRMFLVFGVIDCVCFATLVIACTLPQRLNRSFGDGPEDEACTATIGGE